MYYIALLLTVAKKRVCAPAAHKKNYDTWKVQMKLLLIRNESLKYFNGNKTRPEENEQAGEVAAAWDKADLKAQSDLVLSIHPSEIKQINGCNTSREILLKLESIYQSKGPARMSTLLKQLILHRIQESNKARDHKGKFFDAVDKLEEVDISINQNLLAILLMYSLPGAYENLRIAIESPDELPAPEVLKIKIIEESEVRKYKMRGSVENAMIVSAGGTRSKKAWKRKGEGKGENLLHHRVN